jgi:hypothetical protein
MNTQPFHALHLPWKGNLVHSGVAEAVAKTLNAFSALKPKQTIPLLQHLLSSDKHDGEFELTCSWHGRQRAAQRDHVEDLCSALGLKFAEQEPDEFRKLFSATVAGMRDFEELRAVAGLCWFIGGAVSEFNGPLDVPPGFEWQDDFYHYRAVQA